MEWANGHYVAHLQTWPVPQKHRRGVNCHGIYLGGIRKLNWSPPSAAYMNRISNGSDDGLSPTRRQSIISTSAGLLSIAPFETNFSEILIKIQNFSFTKTHSKISSAKWRPFCPWGVSNIGFITVHGLNEGHTVTCPGEMKIKNPWLCISTV